MPCGELDGDNYSKVQDVASTVVIPSIVGTPDDMFTPLAASLTLIGGRNY